MISVLNLDGEFIESFELPSPEISGISFSLYLFGAIKQLSTSYVRDGQLDQGITPQGDV